MAKRTNIKAAYSHPGIRWFGWPGGRDFPTKGAYVQYRTRDGFICGPAFHTPDWVWTWNPLEPKPTDAVAYRILPAPERSLKRNRPK